MTQYARFIYMSDKPKNSQADVQRVKVTAFITLQAYHAINQLQLRHKARQGRSLPLWRVLDTAVKAYAQKEGITTQSE
jgi:hypothetical protein